MRVVVSGSRAFTDADAAREQVQRRLQELPFGTVITQGGAPGVDTWAREIGEALGLTVETVEANWNDHTGCRCRNRHIEGATCRWAGNRRNREMLDLQPEYVLAFWNGWSPGTRDCIDEAHRRGLSVDLTLIDT